MDNDLDDALDGCLIPWHWDNVQLHNHLDGKPKEWCEEQNWQFGIDFYVVITDAHPAFNTEWGRFNINKKRVYTYLFKNPKHTTMFILRWADNER